MRLGTPAVTTRGLKEAEMERVAGWIDRVLGAGIESPGALESTTQQVREEVRGLCAKFALP